MTAQVPYQLLSPDAQVALTAFRNKLINADFRVNQRGYVSGAATSTANQYTLDRWRVVTSGQSIAFTSSGNVTTVTAPAGGMEQVIEGNNLVSGTHVLSWTGTATATVGGAAVAKGGTVSVTGGSNLTIRFAGGTVASPQFELGTVSTAFESRPIGLELALCQRYFELCVGGIITSANTVSGYIATSVTFAAAKRIALVVARVSDIDVSGVNMPYSEFVTAQGFRAVAQVTTASTARFHTLYSASAEL